MSDTRHLLDGRYQIRQAIGRGGMGEVVCAYDHRLSREVAIKFLSPESMLRPRTLDRFRREISTLARLGHPHIVTLYDSGETGDGRLYLVMEMLRGETLGDKFEAMRSRGEAFSWTTMVPVVQQICDALEAAHSFQVVHRDIKPSNVFCLASPKGFIKLLDFGIAKVLAGDEPEEGDDARTPLTSRGMFVGTPHYAAPEVIDPQHYGPADARADLFSLGVMMYQFLTGVLPFEGAPRAAILARTAYERPPAPRARAPMREIPAAIEAVVVRAMALRAEERHASARALREALDAAAQGLERPSESAAWRAEGLGGVAAERSQTSMRGAAQPITAVVMSPADLRRVREIGAAGVVRGEIVDPPTHANVGVPPVGSQAPTMPDHKHGSRGVALGAVALVGLTALAWWAMPEVVPPRDPPRPFVRDISVVSPPPPVEPESATTGASAEERAEEASPDAANIEAPSEEDVQRARAEVLALLDGFQDESKRCASRNGVLLGVEYELAVKVSIEPPKRRLRVELERNRRGSSLPKAARDCILDGLRALRIRRDPVALTQYYRFKL